jgi:hypothetical protein
MSVVDALVVVMSVVDALVDAVVDALVVGLVVVALGSLVVPVASVSAFVVESVLSSVPHATASTIAIMIPHRRSIIVGILPRSTVAAITTTRRNATSLVQLAQRRAFDCATRQAALASRATLPPGGTYMHTKILPTLGIALALALGSGCPAKEGDSKDGKSKDGKAKVAAKDGKDAKKPDAKKPDAKKPDAKKPDEPKPEEPKAPATGEEIAKWYAACWAAFGTDWDAFGKCYAEDAISIDGMGEHKGREAIVAQGKEYAAAFTELAGGLQRRRDRTRRWQAHRPDEDAGRAGDPRDEQELQRARGPRRRARRRRSRGHQGVDVHGQRLDDGPARAQQGAASQGGREGLGDEARRHREERRRREEEPRRPHRVHHRVQREGHQGGR